jgi:hypothetical protein
MTVGQQAGGQFSTHNGISLTADFLPRRFP